MLNHGYLFNLNQTRKNQFSGDEINELVLYVQCTSTVKTKMLDSGKYYLHCHSK